MVNFVMLTSPPPAKKPVILSGLWSKVCPEAGAVITTIGLIPSTANVTVRSPMFPRISETWIVNI